MIKAIQKIISDLKRKPKVKEDIKALEKEKEL